MWKCIDDFPNYSVSDNGQIKNNTTGRILKYTISKKGYAIIAIKPNGKYGTSKSFRVHREVALAFLPNGTDLPQVNHIDGDKLNNNVSNLEWCTAAYNTKHAFDTGLTFAPKGEASHRAKLTLDEVTFILNNTKITNAELSRKFKVHRGTISRIRGGTRWGHLHTK